MTVYAQSGYQLEVGALALMENDWGLYRFDTLGANASFGNAVPVSEVISSLMADGDLTTTTRFGNRVATFDVKITAEDAGALAAGEAALMAEVDKVNTLTWHVPFGAPTVFEVVRSWPEHQFDDFAEVKRLQRTYRISFECLPFGRSVASVTKSWTGPAEVSPLTSMTGLTVVSGSAAYNSNAGGILVPGILAGGAGAVLQATVTADEYLWLKTFISGSSLGTVAITNFKINGITVAAHPELFGASSATQFYTVPTGQHGGSVTFEFTLPASSGLLEFWTRGYPGPASAAGDTRPKGIDVIDTIGSARAPAMITFTAPSGGAFVYTAPDPNAAVRDQGAGESVFATFTVTDPDGDVQTVGAQSMWFPPGTHSAWIGSTDPQPLMLNPAGVWPTRASGSSVWAYPVDGKAAITFYDTSGAKTIISPSPQLPQGYHGGAIVHSVHSVHPGRSGFAVLDTSGVPVAATLTYYPHWWSHAGQ